MSEYFPAVNRPLESNLKKKITVSRRLKILQKLQALPQRIELCIYILSV